MIENANAEDISIDSRNSSFFNESSDIGERDVGSEISLIASYVSHDTETDDRVSDEDMNVLCEFAYQILLDDNPSMNRLLVPLVNRIVNKKKEKILRKQRLAEEQKQYSNIKPDAPVAPMMFDFLSPEGQKALEKLEAMRSQLNTSTSSKPTTSS
jgi:hypothetical protein